MIVKEKRTIILKKLCCRKFQILTRIGRTNTAPSPMSNLASEGRKMGKEENKIRIFKLDLAR